MQWTGFTSSRGAAEVESWQRGTVVLPTASIGSRSVRQQTLERLCVVSLCCEVNRCIPIRVLLMTFNGMFMMLEKERK